MFLKKKAHYAASVQVARADKKQTDIVLGKLYKDELQRECAVVFVALDSKSNIIGHSVIYEKKAPPPLRGADWFIWNIKVRPEWRRQGVASVLLQEIMKQARKENILHIQGSCTNTPAHMFWYKHGFCAQRYGTPQEDGTCSHMIFYRMDKPEKAKKEQTGYRIIAANKAQLHRIFDEYILNNGVPFFQDKRDDIFGFVAVDENENTVGFITACPDELGAPLIGTRWLIPFIFVNAELRRRGIASTLLEEMRKSAKQENASQLDAMRLNDEAALFFYENNFDICVWYIMSGDIKPVSAALRI